MADTRRRSPRPRPQGPPIWSIWWAIGTIAVGVGLFIFSFSNFIQGRYMTGKGGGGSNLRRAWEEFGPGAYAGESPIHLFFTGLWLAVIVAGVAMLVTRKVNTPRVYRVAAWTVGAILALTSFASLTLLVANWVTGVEYHNFRPIEGGGLLYALWCVIPLIVLVALGYLAVTKAPKKPGRPVTEHRGSGPDTP